MIVSSRICVLDSLSTLVSFIFQPCQAAGIIFNETYFKEYGGEIRTKDHVSCMLLEKMKKWIQFGYSPNIYKRKLIKIFKTKGVPSVTDRTKN